MPQISGAAAPSNNLPKIVDGVCLNGCSNASCVNFRTPVLAVGPRKSFGYSLTGAGDARCVRCNSCGRHMLLKSNEALKEEIARLAKSDVRSTVYRQDGSACYEVSCPNFGQKVSSYPDLYRLNGRTPAGNQRYICGCCGIGFSVGSTRRKSHPQSQRHKDEQLFIDLCNKRVAARVPEVYGISPPTLDRKVDMFYQRSVEFLHHREERLKTLSLERIELSVDRQEHHVNWSDRKDKSHIVVASISSVDAESNYAFGLEPNFDPFIDLTSPDSQAAIINDIGLPIEQRALARVWTPADRVNAINQARAFQQFYRDRLDAIDREDDEALNIALINEWITEWTTQNGTSPQAFTIAEGLPKTGALVHLEYTMYAHFVALRKLIGHARRLSIFVDSEPGADRAISVAFGDRFGDPNFNAAYVTCEKGASVDERRRGVKDTEKAVKQLISTGQAADEWDAKKILAKAALEGTPNIINGKRFYQIPVNTMPELGKQISFITDENRLSNDSNSKLALRASLHPVDSLFNLTRRRVNLFERPHSSQLNKGRKWYGYSPYNPYKVDKRSQMLRLYRNYCLPIKSGRYAGSTPAMVLGLAKGKIEIRRVLAGDT